MKAGFSKPSKYIKGIFIQTNILNKNRRIYHKDVVGGEINRYINEKVNRNSALGELDHPEKSEDRNDNRLSKAGIIVVSLTEDGDNYIGKARVLTTPVGNVISNLIDDGVRFGVSSRACGSVKMNDKRIFEVQKDFRLFAAADAVADPSAPDAFVTALMESKEWVWNNGVLCEAEVAGFQNNINKMCSNKTFTFDNRKFEQLFESYIQKLTKGIK